MDDFFGFFSSLFRPSKALLFFLLLIPHALHSDLGPAGPPLQRGVLVVPQSAHVLTCVPSDETLSGVGVWLIISSDSETLSLRSTITKAKIEDLKQNPDGKSDQPS